MNEMRPLSQSVGESSPGVRCDEDFSLSGESPGVILHLNLNQFTNYLPK